jgi:hypothetical protein
LSFNISDAVIEGGKLIRWQWLVASLILVILVLPDSVTAQSDSDNDWHSSAEYQFGQVMEFVLSGKPQERVDRVKLFITAPELDNILTTEVQFEADETINARHIVDLTQVRLAPFTTVTYWWILEMKSGNEIQIPEKNIDYIDDNFSWESSEEGNVAVYWTGDDPSIGLSALSSANNALPVLTSNIPTRIDNLLRIYVYPRTDDLRAALRLTGRNWIGAHAHPELGVVLVTASNANTGDNELANDISHELTHLLLYQATGGNYQSIPLWLEEGLATILEPNNNGRLDETLQGALESDATIPFQQLCRSFPSDNERLLLAYAQSASMVSYIQDEFGNHAPSQLIGAIASGADCENVTEKVLGLSMDELSQEWLEHNAPVSVLTRMWRQGRLLLLAIVVGFILMSLIVIGPSKK